MSQATHGVAPPERRGATGSPPLDRLEASGAEAEGRK